MKYVTTILFFALLWTFPCDLYGAQEKRVDPVPILLFSAAACVGCLSYMVYQNIKIEKLENDLAAERKLSAGHLQECLDKGTELNQKYQDYFNLSQENQRLTQENARLQGKNTPFITKNDRLRKGLKSSSSDDSYHSFSSSPEIE